MHHTIQSFSQASDESVDVIRSLPSPKNARRKRRLRVLLVTPEVSESEFLSANGKLSPCVKAGGLADVSALLIDSLTAAGADVHLALPHFRSLFEPGKNGQSRRLHLCEDREFYYRKSVYDGSSHSNLRAALAFQRDVIHYVLPRVRPDIVHCHDWMTGLVPAAARSLGIPSIFTMHNLHDVTATLAQIEDRGIDSATFWNHLFYSRYPYSYEETRSHNPASMLGSGILAADRMNTVSPSFLEEIAGGGHHAPWAVAEAVRGKVSEGHAHGILNSLPATRSPGNDRYIYQRYDSANHVEGKAANKIEFQRMLGLDENVDSPLFFWPSRLDPGQKGCQILAEIIEATVRDHFAENMQVVFVADGPYAKHFENIIHSSGLYHRIAIRAFHEPFSHLGYAASDFILMPSSFEPCGLSQMVGLRYGSLPVAHRTGGLRDTISQLSPGTGEGNGFLFEVHNGEGLRWAIDKAMDFHRLSHEEKARTRTRIMDAAETDFSPGKMTEDYFAMYRELVPIDV